MFTTPQASSLRYQISHLGLASFTVLALLGCQTPPPAPVAPPPIIVPVYSGPTLPIEQSERGVQIFLPSAALFEVGKADLNPTESAAYISRVAQLLNSKTTNNIQLEGHTDNVGSASSNQALSEARARTVRDALVKQGVTTARLSTVGYAFNRPVASNATEEGRKFNRRVEILILDEKIENITKGEAPNAFESAWAKLKKLIEQGLIKPMESK
jgi:outer membrane protein OmpA-like peptidoglycan-associated protein